jgi:thiol:disulfide interchange protein DsbC
VNIETIHGLRKVALVKALAIGFVAFVAAKSAHAGEAEIKRAIEGMYPTAKVTSVAPTGVKGIMEVVVGGTELVYAEENGKFLFYGPLVDVVNRKNLTDARKDDLTRVDFKTLPLNLAVKVVKGDGSRIFASFEDPNCGYCKQLHEGLKKVDNYTLYTFLTPILSEDSKVKTQAILCSPDKARALNAWMESGQVPAGSQCETKTSEVLTLASRLGVKGTPTLIFESGKRTPGYVPAPQLEIMLNEAKAVPKS